VIEFVHGMPDVTWNEPDPNDPLSLVDQVELALAYGCSDSVSHETMLQYIHYNRHHNSMRINATGKVIEELKTEIREDLEEKVSEQERKIANNTDQSMKNEILFHNIEAMVADQKNEMAKQKNETANMLSAIFSNIIGVVRADEARIQELEGKISRNLEDKMATQDTNIAKNLDLIGTFSRAVSINEARVDNNSYLIGAVSGSRSCQSRSESE